MDIENLTKTELIQLRDKINATLMIRGDEERAEKKAELQKYVGRYFKETLSDYSILYSSREATNFGEILLDTIYQDADEIELSGTIESPSELEEYKEVTKDEWEAAKKRLIEHTVKQLEKL